MRKALADKKSYNRSNLYLFALFLKEVKKIHSGHNIQINGDFIK